MSHIVQTEDNPAPDGIDMLLIRRRPQVARGELTRWFGLVKTGGPVVLHRLSPESAARILQPPRYRDFRQVDRRAWAVNWCAPSAADTPMSNALDAAREAMLHLNPMPAVSSGEDALVLASARLQDLNPALFDCIPHRLATRFRKAKQRRLRKRS